jgi:hypothetical protein
LKSDADGVVAFNTLELFAYGTYNDYITTRDQYLELNPTQINHLKKLSLVSLAIVNKVLT